MQETSTNLPSTKKTPSHLAYQIREDVGGKIIWKQIGIVWPHRDLKGNTIYVTCLPEDGRIVLREYAESSKQTTKKR